MNNEIKTLTDSIESFKKKEYIHDFTVENDLLKCRETGESFFPEDVKIDRTERYEGDSNPDDMSIIYGISTNTGTKGILIDAFGVYANQEISEFIKNVPLEREDNLQK